MAAVFVSIPDCCRLQHRLLSGAGRVVLYPSTRPSWHTMPNVWDLRPGAPLFQQRAAGPGSMQLVDTPGGTLECYEHQLYVALPGPGAFYHEIILIEDLPHALHCDLKDGTDLHLNVESRETMLRVKVRCPHSVDCA
jgi:hypothetical protein